MIKLGEILDGVNRKDEKSWEQLFKACYAPLCTYSEKIVHDIDTAKDIVQELFVTMWSSDLCFKTAPELLSYMYRSVYNNTLIHIRNQKNRERLLNKMYEEQNLNETDSTEDFLSNMVQEEIIRLLYVHIDDLPKERRKIIELSIGGFSGKEIAEKLGISINTVKVQKRKGIEYLRDCLMNIKNEYDI